MSAENLSIGYVSTYPPRACGIATFTRDLAQALIVRRRVQRTVIVPIQNDPSRPSNGNGIDQYDRASYVVGAGFLNESNLDAVSIQHEFGIFGGQWGEYVLDLCRNLETPFVTTFHSVIMQPNAKALDTVRELCRLSTNVVVTLESAKKALRDEYGIPIEKIRVIPHGASIPDQKRRSYARQRFRLRNRIVLATTGLINSGKGIEHAVKSLSYLVKDWPNILYLVIGETHPEVRKREGEVYRNKLVGLTKRLKLERNVRFVDEYLPEADLSLYMQAADIYVAPYVGRDQVSSGTITFALTHGKVVISTPTVFAEEALSNNRGLLCDFADEYSIAKCVRRILGDSKLRRKVESNAFKYGQKLAWANVADEYADVFRSAKRLEETVTATSKVSET
ncbi:MAG TPA: glycosyltransferase family 4 protein [archaeon]|nr:glycosyltransferase family 4 protein [archaeon]